jgi:uncharacterized phage protein (TIGR02218 family)
MRSATPQMLALLNGPAYAGLFDGSTNAVTATALSEVTASGMWCFYLRFRFVAGGSSNQFIFNNSHSSTDICSLNVLNNSTLRFGIKNGATWTVKISPVYDQKAWHNAVGICVAGVPTLYVDGQLITGGTGFGVYPEEVSALTIGASTASTYRYKGAIDHLAFYSGFVPTAEQIAELTTSGELNGIRPLAFIGFDEGQGSTLTVTGVHAGTASWAGTPAYVKETPFGTPASTFYMADLYTFTLHDGTILRYTSADVNLNVGGTIFSCSDTGPLLKRGKTRSTVGIEVDTLSINVYANGGQSINGTPWIQAVRMGKLDDARVRMDRLIAKTWNDTSAGALLMFEGRVASVTAQRYEATLDVVSDLELLDVKLPRPVFQSGCMNNFGDTGCKMVKADFAVTGTVASATASTITTALSQSADYFALGTIEFTSGANAGLKRSVRGFVGGVFTLSTPLPSVPLAGDTFTANPGCNKSRAAVNGDCVTKFNNVINFRAFPYIPLPETTL